VDGRGADRVHAPQNDESPTLIPAPARCANLSGVAEG